MKNIYFSHTSVALKIWKFRQNPKWINKKSTLIIVFTVFFFEKAIAYGHKMTSSQFSNVQFSYPIASQPSRHKVLCWSLISFLGFGSRIIVEMLLRIVECDNIWWCRKMSLSCTFLSSFMLEQSKSNHDWICADLK